jgi:flagellar motor component MotA
MDKPEQIGAGKAVALVTTFYGSVIANIVRAS